MDSAGEPTRLGLEVRFDAEPIEGRIYDQQDQTGLDRRFLGWLGLISALEAASGPVQEPPQPAEGEPR
jgi:hypothetical protein